MTTTEGYQGLHAHRASGGYHPAAPKEKKAAGVFGLRKLFTINNPERKLVDLESNCQRIISLLSRKANICFEYAAAYLNIMACNTLLTLGAYSDNSEQGELIKSKAKAWNVIREMAYKSKRQASTEALKTAFHSGNFTGMAEGAGKTVWNFGKENFHKARKELF